MFESIYSYVEKDELTKYIRLTMVIFVYIVGRQYYSSWASKKQTQRQLALDEKEKREKPERERKEREEEEEKLKKEAASFGWGKKTRKDVKLKQTILEDQVSELRERNQSAYDAAEDHDIDDLLED